jgi:predicted AAA+ superfamily ATPase
VLLGSAPLQMQQGLTESLAGRFEVIHLPHWSYAEMRAAFGFSLEEFLYFGAYPGAAPLIDDPPRWRRYLLDALIETTIARDVLLMTRVDKPALLRRHFEAGCRQSGRILSYTKMLGQLQDAGSTTTLAHYLDLLGSREVNFVVRASRTVLAIEVKSGRAPDAFSDLAAFAETFRPRRTLLAGGDGSPVDKFLARPVEHWIGV